MIKLINEKNPKGKRTWKWLETFLEEKEVNLDTQLNIDNNFGLNYRTVYEHLLTCQDYERAKIKNILVKIDFQNGDVKHFLKYLAVAMTKGEF